MKTVGKQLQEARLARNWTPELASRETKIKVDRLKDLESDDYSHFNNATYARGFVRTYARALGLDEYQILRQLDNKLPDDDTANIVSAEGGVAYLPETAMPPRVAHRDFTGLYVVMGSGAVVMLIIIFVLFRAYQVGELGKWTGDETASSAATTNGAPANGVADDAPRAKPVDSDTPPPIPQPVTNVVAVAPADGSTPTDAAPKALPVDPSAPNTAPATTPAADSGTPTPRALPVDPSALTAANTVTPSAPPPADPTTPTPKALPVDPSTLNSPVPPAPEPASSPAPSAPPPADSPAPAPRALPVDPSALSAPSAPSTDTAIANAPKALPVSPADLAAASNPAQPTDNGPVVMPPSSAPTTDGAKPLVLTASRDSFVKVTTLDPESGDKPVYAAVLHSGQSVSFDGRKFSVAVDNPSAVDIKLDGVNYGPHDDGTDPETFTVISHVQ